MERSMSHVIGIGKSNDYFGGVNADVYDRRNLAGTTRYGITTEIDNSSPNKLFYVEQDPVNTNYPYIRADLANAIGPTVNELRQAIQVQRILERDARSGTRYTEIVQSHFGVHSI